MAKLLSTVPLGSGIKFHRPEAPVFEPLQPTDPAIKAMTDLKKIPARIIYPNEPIDAANEKMIANKVRLLFVVNYSDQILGIITAQDILGEKPVKFAQENNVKRSEILVKDIMTPSNEIDVIEIKTLSQATVADVIETLRHRKQQHILVVDYQGPSGEKMVRGIFSLNQIARQLGIPIKTYDIADTLVEIAKILQSR
ncbi:MAG: CBS domain-containing protein [Leptospiraceae bacterium]|nr:CBS domain-containing protein [Leptospiraceae bacterium]MDW7976962.1 CBS domain-containing protein [Leptospiraceae bacterium]